MGIYHVFELGAKHFYVGLGLSPAMGTVFSRLWFLLSPISTIRHLLLQLALKRSTRVYPNSKLTGSFLVSREVRLITSKIVFKPTSAYEALNEAAVSKFILSNTSILTLKVYYAWTDVDQSGGILMSRVPGKALRECWNSLPPRRRDRVREQLIDYLRQLRSLPQPRLSLAARPGASESTGWIGGVTGGPCSDHRLERGLLCGPFSSESEFSDYRIAGLERLS